MITYDYREKHIAIESEHFNYFDSNTYQMLIHRVAFN